MTMTGKERFLAATLGEPVDRVPIWLREGFDFHQPLPEADDFTYGWRATPEYRALWEFARPWCDMRVRWAPGGHFNRTLGIDPRLIEAQTEDLDAETRRTVRTVHTPDGDLTETIMRHRNEATAWHTECVVKTSEDLEALRHAPFEVAPASYKQYEAQSEALGDRGVMCLALSSPWVVFSTTMSFEMALTMALTEPERVHAILGEITDRALACLEETFQRPLDTIANIGGCEQCTPPMLSFDAFREFVVPYEARMVGFLKERGVPVNCHCHGRVSGALAEIVNMGYASTDPVEGPEGGGDGDVTVAQARAIVGDRLTLVGNLQFDELERLEPDAIRARVREILDSGKRRLVLSSSAGPISAMTPRMIENYKAWIEAALEYGGC